jgi:hypothetical protein
MKVLTLLCGLAASGLVIAAPQLQFKRAAAPAYAAHSIDQPVRFYIFINCHHSYLQVQDRPFPRIRSLRAAHDRHVQAAVLFRFVVLQAGRSGILVHWRRNERRKPIL